MATRLVSDLPDLSVAPRPQPFAADIRQRMDATVHRSWAEFTRRVARVVLLVLADVAASVLAVFAALWISAALAAPAPPSWSEIWPLAVLVALAQPLVLGAFGGYGVIQSRASFTRVLFAVLCTAALAWAHGLLLPEGIELLSGTALLLYAAFASMMVFGGRVTVDQSLAYAYRHGWGQRRVLVVGSAKETARLMRLLRTEGAPEMRMVGRIALRGARAIPGREMVPDLEPALRSSGASEVVIASSGLSFESFETLVHRCFEAGAAVSIAPSTLHRINPRFELTKTRIGAVLRLRPGGAGLPRLAIKRAMDVALSIAGLILLAPLLFAIALVIKLDTPGPAVFRQLRTGVGGRSFWMYKFRTMIDDAEQIKPQLHHLNESGDPRLFKIRNDPRVTRVGRFLRRTSLDELPQLLNVLAGEMSVIGPRPFFPEDLDQYAEHHFERLSVLPGITGLWQVSGRSSVLDFEEVVRLDQHYIHHWSVWMDLRILALTLPAVLRRDGAY
ncbi:hypothetical protein BH23GEM7_BH23GEM7_02890 [soil metagenome]